MAKDKQLSKAAGEAELRKVERLLYRLIPDRQSYAHLINALLFEAERPEVRIPILQAILHSLLSLVDRASADGKKLQAALVDLVDAAKLPTDTNPKSGPDEKGNTTSYTLGDSTVAFVAHLRFDLGLSALHVCRHLRDYHGAPTPPGALLALIAGVCDFEAPLDV